MGGGAVVRTASKAAALGGYRAAHTPWLKEAPPTLEEAKEAASDLKDALRGLHSPHASIGSRNSAVESKPASPESCCLEGSDATKGCAAVLSSGPRHVVQSFSLPPSAPRYIVQTFSLLQEDPEVQNIVASLASDKGVWDAVMKNEKVMKFYKTHKINAQPVEAGACSEESVNENGKSMPGPAKEGSAQSSEHGLRDFMHSIKLKVKQIVNTLSDLIESFMVESTGPGSTAIVRTSTSDGSYEDMAVGASFIALTIATIMLILLKREDS